jgi:dUTP pyrophosphatase
MDLTIKVTDEALLPVIATEGSAGLDLCFATDFVLKPEQVTKVGTGVSMEIPTGYAGFVLPRSHNKELELTNVIGLIDSDYRGEIFLKIRNKSHETFLGYKLDSMFQIVILPVALVSTLNVVDELTATDRGDGGFGSTK